MLRENYQFFMRLVFAADLSLTALAFQLSSSLSRLRSHIETDLFIVDGLILSAVVIWGFIFWFSPQCYSFRMRKAGQILTSTLKASLWAGSLFVAYVFAMGYHEIGRFQVVSFIGLNMFMALLMRTILINLLEFYRKRGFNFRTILVMGTGKTAQNFADRILDNPQFGIKLIGFLDWNKRTDLWRYKDIPCLGNVESLPEILKSRQVDIVTFAVGKKHLGDIEESLAICEEMGATVAVTADFFSVHSAQMKIGTFLDLPMILYDTAPRKDIPQIIKDMLDRFLAFIGLIIIAPVMFMSALLIKFTSRGPVIFRQQRFGLNGRKFTLYKFRTMVPDAEKLKKELMHLNEVTGAAFKMSGDPRITRVGKFLRKTSIDELPQLFNVLRGEMSLVGPRPPLAEEVARYDRWQRRKLSVKPGLTCLWQISGRSNVSFEEWMKLDLEYIDNWSLWKDIKILAKTVPAVLKGSGAK